MRQIIILTTVSVIAIVLGTGCQESDATQIRKARLIGTENLQLKKQLKEKDQQIEDLKKEIEQVKAEMAQKEKQSGQTSIKSLKLLMESEKRAEGLVIENRKLKEELEKLKAK